MARVSDRSDNISDGSFSLSQADCTANVEEVVATADVVVMPAGTHSIAAAAVRVGVDAGFVAGARAETSLPAEDIDDASFAARARAEASLPAEESLTLPAIESRTSERPAAKGCEALRDSARVLTCAWPVSSSQPKTTTTGRLPPRKRASTSSLLSLSTDLPPTLSNVAPTGTSCSAACEPTATCATLTSSPDCSRAMPNVPTSNLTDRCMSTTVSDSRPSPAAATGCFSSSSTVVAASTAALSSSCMELEAALGEVIVLKYVAEDSSAFSDVSTSVSRATCLLRVLTNTPVLGNLGLTSGVSTGVAEA
eukprot:CAMPEP_0115862394 /NCGR_PEP_ID=MMETSP0287-20121206/18151_1 /TAXON_ID=412157 /ORGANISM="Chrysochromulina rotalis, Strain UIO044" /LENGTH=308 /DNA_ID=CAMNT_0003316809 /DNA_START=411 /DNA_END=1333 /DNA_ORIENTATION=-